MPIIIGVCPTCQEVRFKSKKDFKPGVDKPTPADFMGMNGQDDPDPAADPKAPALCVRCGAIVKFMQEPKPKTEESYEEMKRKAIEQREAGAPPRDPNEWVNGLPPKSGAAVKTLFSANPDETVTEMKRVSDSLMLVITNKRIVSINIDALIMEAMNG